MHSDPRHLAEVKGQLHVVGHTTLWEEATSPYLMKCWKGPTASFDSLQEKNILTRKTKPLLRSPGLWDSNRFMANGHTIIVGWFAGQTWENKSKWNT